MQNLATEQLARAIVAQVTGGLCADIVALKVEIAMLRAELERREKEKE